MTQHISSANTHQGKTINPDQFTQIIDAILDGKYSLACFLLLRGAGYNPLHYIPYRTYHRLVKQHCNGGKRSKDKSSTLASTYPSSKSQSHGTASKTQLTEITDLAYLEEMNEQHPQVRGGDSEQGSLFNSWNLKRVFSGIPTF